MILADTSAWIEFLRATGSRADRQLQAAMRHGTVATTEVVVMEILAGAVSDRHLADLRRLMASCSLVPTAGLDDYEAAAAIYRRCRQRGATVRSLIDCLVAAVAIRSASDLLHRDRDFRIIARHSTLSVA